jgi:hypothetical protein
VPSLERDTEIWPDKRRDVGEKDYIRGE